MASVEVSIAQGGQARRGPAPPVITGSAQKAATFDRLCAQSAITERGRGLHLAATATAALGLGLGLHHRHERIGSDRATGRVLAPLVRGAGHSGVIAHRTPHRTPQRAAGPRRNIEESTR